MVPSMLPFDRKATGLHHLRAAGAGFLSTVKPTRPTADKLFENSHSCATFQGSGI